MAEKQSDVNNGGKKKSGGCLVILLALFLTPLVVIVLLYFFNQDFKLNVNSVMSGAPGVVGDFFEKFPTKEEQQEQIRLISENLITLDNERAVDKLLVLKGEDQDIYNQVVQDMLRINPNKTRQILDKIREATLGDSVLSNTVKRIQDETQQELVDQAKSIEGMDIDSAVVEIEKIIDDSINGHDIAAQVFEQMDPGKARVILYKLDPKDRDKIFSFMSSEKSTAIKTNYNNIQKRTNDLVQLAGVYKSQSAESVAAVIGNTDNYTMEELATIYKHLGVKKAGEVLSKIEDDAFIRDLTSAVKAHELNTAGKDILTPDILKSLKIYKEFDDNIKELTSVYSKMPNDKVIAIIKDMMLNASPSKVYELDNGELITLSDEDLMIGILKGFPDKKTGEILTAMDKTLSTELTRLLALPAN